LDLIGPTRGAERGALPLAMHPFLFPAFSRCLLIGGRL